MSIGICELLLEEKEWTPLKIANKFVEVFKRDPRRGYAKRFYKFLMEIESGEELLRKIEPKSERNGAAMRSYSIGILGDENEIIERCDLQSSLTHKTEKALISAQAIALTNHFFIYDKGRKSELLDYLQDIQGVRWTGKWSGEVKVNAIETVEAVISLIISEDSLKEILRKSIEFSGDVDTVASLGLAIGKMSREINNDLPNWLYEELEEGKYGKGYLKELDERLNELKVV